MKQDKKTIKTYFETGDKPTQEQFENLIDSYLDSKQIKGETNRRFIIDETGEVSVTSEKQIPEYTLSEIRNNKLALLKDGTPVKEIDLTSYIDDTNLARLVSGTLDANGLATFTRDDNSTFTIDLSNLKGTQLQADFNQTDGTKPDFIKGFPLAILDYNGTKKFETKEIQFDENFEFNNATKKIIFKKDNFAKRSELNFDTSVTSINNTNTSSTNETSTSNSLKFFDLPHFNDNTEDKWLSVENMIVKTFVDGDYSGKILANGISPIKIKIEAFLEIKSAHNFSHNQKLIPIYYEELNDSGLIEGIRDSPYLSFFKYNVVTKKTSWGGSNSGWITDQFTIDYPKIINGVTTRKRTSNYLKNEPDFKNGVYANLQFIDFGYKIKMSVVFSDTTNSNKLNKKYTTNFRIEKSSIDILS
ncbi:hypothetical protein [Tenacibaculum halocynthiae]|uniref:hypothetical protein n=1 Tax=Tenacibaculum halocynthiae TaxID=1254437 RepID=UPI003D660EA4